MLHPPLRTNTSANSNSTGIIWRILTINLWSATYQLERRMKSIGDVIASHGPEVIALQEMTAYHWRVCSSIPAFQKYHWSTPPVKQPYFTMLGSLVAFAKKPTRMLFSKSRFKRDLLSGVVRKASLSPMAFATAHLDGLTCSETRKKQMLEALYKLDIYSDVVFCGDTNMKEHVDEVITLPTPWKDAWIDLAPTDPGYTSDLEIDSQMTQFDSLAVENHARWRYDRCFVKLSNYGLLRIELLDSPIETKGLFSAVADDVWPSARFGLLLTIGEKNVDSEEETETKHDDAISSSYV
eukprot:TRINITY_DN5497_c0_g2_i1.p1 TRINITY_DN5497_c0_g2~~TRINITY_DN5497_c0_g2_i1.p1  ORF type:complete len:323 (+),score=21.22 TRINITY_DN5497_c0_g2_i1:86-970(+)